MTWMNKDRHGLPDTLVIISLSLLFIFMFWRHFLCSPQITNICFIGCLIVPGMNTSHLCLVWLASMVANGDDTNGLERSQGSAAAARWTQSKEYRNNSWQNLKCLNLGFLNCRMFCLCMQMAAKLTFVLQVECGSFGLLILAFFLSLLFLCLWIEVPKDYNDYDWWASPQLSLYVADRRSTVCGELTATRWRVVLLCCCCWATLVDLLHHTTNIHKTISQQSSRQS